MFRPCLSSPIPLLDATYHTSLLLCIANQGIMQAERIFLNIISTVYHNTNQNYTRNFTITKEPAFAT
jgi:hypothetical protein